MSGFRVMPPGFSRNFSKFQSLYTGRSSEFFLVPEAIQRVRAYTERKLGIFPSLGAFFTARKPIQRRRAQNFFKSQSLYGSGYFFIFSTSSSFISPYFPQQFPHISSYSFIFSTYFLRFFQVPSTGGGADTHISRFFPSPKFSSSLIFYSYPR